MGQAWCARVSEWFPQLLTNYKLPRVHREFIPAKFGGAMEGLERTGEERPNMGVFFGWFFFYRVSRS